MLACESTEEKASQKMANELKDLVMPQKAAQKRPR
jgi:hypothetical protein